MKTRQLTRYCLLIVITAIVVAGCASGYTTDYDSLYGEAEVKERNIGWSEFQGRAQQGHVSFIKDVKPILDSRCIACHACNDAPCQQKLTSYEGIDRGASKTLVYDGARLTAEEPTRLFVDAKTTEEWRDKGFYPVLNERIESAEADLMGSLLFRVLNQKFINPLSDHGGSPQPLPKTFDFSLDRSQECPTIEEFDYYEEQYPLWGMPFGLPGLTTQEFSTISRWLAEGAKFDPLPPISKPAQEAVSQWESFLNGASLKQQLTSRYIYEHLFLGHLHFEKGAEREFFKLVRSYTPPGEAIDEIATVRPYDDPETDRVYYRLRPIKSTIVDKTHLVYTLNDQRMERFKTLFLEPDYNVESLPSYDPEKASNPFITFAAIPANSRYQFLLDEAQYFIGGFIKSPVCRGQIALNVIDDQFWALFLDPEKDSISNDTAFIAQQAKNLKLPAASEDTLRPTDIWFRFARAQKNYREAKNNYLDAQYENGNENSLNSLWNGSNQHLKDANNNPIANDNAALTIFRHFDSATVVKGLIGSQPKTVWVLDYPIFERIHYLLVAGFNVYGNVGHQLSTRLYMDYLRMESENNFLDFLPSSQRKLIRDSWYKGAGSNMISYFDKPLIGEERETRISYKTADSKTELLGYIHEHLASLKLSDPINRCTDKPCAPKNASSVEQRIFPEIQRLASITGTQLKPIPDLAYLRVIPSGEKESPVSYSLIHNRAHTNISYIFNEDARLEPENDTLTVTSRYIGSYPNFYFNVHENQLSEFIDQLKSIETPEDESAFIQRFGVRRADTKFWAINDWFNEDYLKQEPINAGWFDLNRYENR
ncbi:fatty acid cis/trans isomerase [Alkalimarinus sediminis]|uniref:Fatty acid cis/trans isomerase n=1 Tax=Alkalimarinus sediminis TaxID=1632866 RepID=A0A9E8HLJ8_9ALTE|nr:fatty acid cis/trans isomerase [Alkalimarinus sediminis]UZW74928.1 fatty acid cis/trans isomerase [Alkalimarinus sediminis]